MEKFNYIVKPGKAKGVVKLSGAKNSVLRLLAASLLFDKSVSLTNYPSSLLDVVIHQEMLESLGKKISVNNDKIEIFDNGNLKSNLIWEDKRSIRNTLLILGALVSRTGYGEVPLPGGCKLGERKYDIHEYVLNCLGAKVFEKDGYLCAQAENGLRGAEIHLRMRSTGATENAIIASCLAQGKTNIWNPHIRPEIIDLIDFLNKSGADIKVHGQERIEVNGVESLNEANHRVMPDNMEALTWLVIAATAGEQIEIQDFPFEHLEVPLIFLRESGIEIFRNESSAIVRKKNIYPLEISTGPYPGINSDMQPILACVSVLANGKSHIIDLRFPGRYLYAEEMAKMGVKSEVIGDLLVIDGGMELFGAEVNALDLRAGVALLILALSAKGETVINNAWQIERGYDLLIKKMSDLGIEVEKVYI